MVFVLAVVATPRELFWPFGIYALILLAVWRVARIPLRWILPRMLIEAPFIVLAVLLPFAEGGERVTVAGVHLSVSGLYAAWGIVIKGTLGVAASLTVAATTTARELPVALSRLRVPGLIVSMLTLMIRYVDVLAAEARRMRMARISRGDSPRMLHQVGATAKGVGSLFLRSYERGERVYLAMLSRGFDGQVPQLAVGAGCTAPASTRQWLLRAAARVGCGDGGDQRLVARGLRWAEGSVTTPAVRVRDLRYAYPDGQVALDGIDLEVAPGERVAVLGPNGAGKTTLMLHLNGVLSASQGTVEIGGIALSRSTLRDIRRRVGLVFQDPDDQLFMPTVAQDVAFGPANFGVRGDELDARVARALEVVSMTELADRSPAHLSGGQRRRAALATVLACEPDILVLDEPSANLDPVARRELAETLSGLDATMLIVTHDLPYAAQLCDRAIVMDGGVIVADGAIGEVLSDAELLAAHRLELPWGFVVQS